jgi:hypothetical protein
MTTPAPETIEREKDKYYLSDAELIRKLRLPKVRSAASTRRFGSPLMVLAHSTPASPPVKSWWEPNIPTSKLDWRLKMDRETIQTLLDLLNPLHGSLDKQTYDEKVKSDFDTPGDAEYAVDVTAQQERDLCQAVMILESRLRDFNPPLGA